MREIERLRNEAGDRPARFTELILISRGDEEPLLPQCAEELGVRLLSCWMREASEERIPSCPMAMPSVTEMVQNSRGVPPAAATPFFTACAWRISEMLQGAASFQQEATPTKGWWICSFVRPMA